LARATGEDDVGDPNVVGEISESGEAAILVGESEIRDLAEDGQHGYALFGFKEKQQSGQHEKPRKKHCPQP